MRHRTRIALLLAGLLPGCYWEPPTGEIMVNTIPPGASCVVSQLGRPLGIAEPTPAIAITTLGEIAHPGGLTLDPPADLLQALALAGGPTEFADRSRIFVVRRFPEFRRIRFDYDAIVQNQGGAAQFPLRQGDAIVIE